MSKDNRQVCVMCDELLHQNHWPKRAEIFIDLYQDDSEPPTIRQFRAAKRERQS